jgi:hypothetical protein
VNLDAHVALLKTRLRDLAAKFTDPEDFEALIATAAAEYSRYRPRILSGQVALAAGTAAYPVAGLIGILYSTWGRTTGRKPWEDSPGTPPRYSVEEGSLVFSPAPTAFDLATWGATFYYQGKSLHVIDAEGSSVPAQEEPLILLRARAEALSELADDQAAKPGKNGSGFSATRDETLAARANALMEDWERKMGIGSGVLQRVTVPAAGGRS